MSDRINHLNLKLRVNALSSICRGRDGLSRWYIPPTILRANVANDKSQRKALPVFAQ